jgi:AraC-like DNA-binding protein
MHDDPLSDVLRRADVQSVMSGGFRAGGDWAIRFPPPDKVKFFGVVTGRCWLTPDGDAKAIRLEQGDVVLLAAARGFVLASDPAVAPQDAHALFAGRTSPIIDVGRPGGADEVLQLGGHVRLHASHGESLAQVLPPLVHVRGASPQADTLRWILQQLVHEREGLPGAGLASSQLAHLLFVQLLRAHLADGGQLRASWLRAAMDSTIAPALQLMHGNPGHPWRLEQLARAAAMSRTRFAEHFKNVAGEAPLTYLTRWRMRLAEYALRRGDTPVTELARQLGYASESAFSHAFKRVVGLPPRRYGVSARSDSEAASP